MSITAGTNSFTRTKVPLLTCICYVCVCVDVFVFGGRWSGCGRGGGGGGAARGRALRVRVGGVLAPLAARARAARRQQPGDHQGARARLNYALVST